MKAWAIDIDRSSIAFAKGSVNNALLDGTARPLQFDVCPTALDAIKGRYVSINTDSDCLPELLICITDLPNVDLPKINAYAQNINTIQTPIATPQQIQVTQQAQVIQNNAIKNNAIKNNASKNSNSNNFNTKTQATQNNGYDLIDYRTLNQYLPQSIMTQITHALGLLKWRLEHQFCGRCGNPTTLSSNEYATVCLHCNHKSYPVICPCVIVAITRQCPQTHKTQLLLAQHHRHKDGLFGLIAGFIEIGEDVLSAIKREVQEETQLTIKNIRPIASQAWYPNNLMLGFIADYDQGKIAIEPNELNNAKFFDLDDLPKIPHHGTIARQLIDTVIQEHNKQQNNQQEICPNNTNNQTTPQAPPPYNNSQ